jgi:hypothetical protein
MAPTILTVPIEEALAGGQPANGQLENTYPYTLRAFTGAIKIQLWVITKCSIQPTRIGIQMESNRITYSYRCAAFAIAQLFAFSCLMTCGCERQASLTQQVSSDDYNPQKERIERVLGVKLPESVRNCRYDFKDYGMGSNVGWGFFEISRADLPYLLDASDNLPDASELGQNPGVRFNIEKYLERTGESIAWWKPLTLQKRQYTQQVIGSENVTDSIELVMLPAVDICVGEIRDDLMGVYLVYHCN